MLTRRKKIIEVLKTSTFATIDELCTLTAYSSSTIRRDVAKLVEEGIIRAMHGGVIINEESKIEPPYEVRESLNVLQKKVMCKKAMQEVNDGDIIFIDGGTSLDFVLPPLENKKDITLITCNIHLISQLWRYPNIVAIIIGGELFCEANSVGGNMAVSFIETNKMFCDKAFITCNAVSFENGVSNRMINRIPLKQKAMQIAKQSILLADNSKVGETSLATIAPLTDFSKMITDELADKEEIRKYRSVGVEVIIAE